RVLEAQQSQSPDTFRAAEDAPPHLAGARVEEILLDAQTGGYERPRQQGDEEPGSPSPRRHVRRQPERGGPSPPDNDLDLGLAPVAGDGERGGGEQNENGGDPGGQRRKAPERRRAGERHAQQERHP